MSAYNKNNKQKEVHTIPSVFPSCCFKDGRIQNSSVTPVQLLVYDLSTLDKHGVLNVVLTFKDI